MGKIITLYHGSANIDGLYIQDIMRGGIGNDDARIPRNVCK